MSENANQFQFHARLGSTRVEDMENVGSRGWTKDAFGQIPHSRVPARGTRTVLGSLTNKPQEFTTLPIKQNVVNKDYEKLQQSSDIIIPTIQIPFQLASGFRTVPEQDSDQVVDLSCHEMETLTEHDGLENRRHQNSFSMDAHESADSPILLDISSDDVSLVESDGDDDGALENRIDRLLSMAEYRDEIYQYLRRAELLHRPKPNYMRRQSDITPNMRSILVDWLVEVADEYKLHRETLFLAVDYVDRFLSVMAVQRQKLQLVGTAAMFIAAKYEEIYPPEVGEFVYITDDTYTKQQVLRMESLILKVLSFDVAVPTIHLFCERFLKEVKAEQKLTSLVMYLTELSLVDGDTYLQYLPSITACAAICLARHTVGEEPWPRMLVDVTQYKMPDFISCMRDLLVTFNGAVKHPQQAIQEKYKQDKYHEVALIRPPQSLPQPNC